MSTTMMMSGKSALRKKRFTVGRRRVAPSFFGTQPAIPLPRYDLIAGVLWYSARSDGLMRRRDQVRVEDRDVREVPVALGEVEAVPDDEAIGDLEADVAHGHVDLAPLRLRQQRHHLE